MQKLTMQEMQESFVQIEFSKMELTVLSSLFSSGVSDIFATNANEYPLFADRIESCGNAMLLAMEGVDRHTFPDNSKENAEMVVKLLEKLSLIFVNSMQIKH